jgi:polysaccharide pyruvyl transferase WcaK-like protein
MLQSNSPINILITEAYTDANVGSGALVENSLRLLRERFPQARFRVMAVYPQAFESLAGVEKSLPDPFDYPYRKSKAAKIKWALKTFLTMLLVRLQAKKDLKAFRSLASKFQDYLWADWVISIHAERIKESFYIDALYTLFSFHIAHLLGKKVILFPCTLGPYGFGTRSLVDRWLRDVDLLFTRDTLSFDLAHETAGLPAGKIVECADVAVMQEYLPREEALRVIGCDSEDQLVGVSVMRWRYIKGAVSKYSTYASYVTEMAKVVDHLVANYGVKVVLYPTNYAIRGCTTDDREAIRDIYEMATQKEKIVCVEEFLSPSQLKGALSCSAVNITTRMHACIFSTGAGVPTLSVNYLYKLREYMASLGLADYSIDIEDFNAEWMLGAFEKMWHRRCEIRAQIEAGMAAKRSLLQAKLELLKQLV